jgi:ferrochelatase
LIIRDHIETLYELDQELVEEAEEHGMTLKRAESLNDHPLFIKALADIAASHLDTMDGTTSTETTRSGAVETWNQGRTSRQMQIRCPGCINPVCGEQKKFFADGTVGVGEDQLRS